MMVCRGWRGRGRGRGVAVVERVPEPEPGSQMNANDSKKALVQHEISC